MRASSTARVLALLSLPLFLGCGSSLGINKGGKLTGEVTIDGKPVTAGAVFLMSEDNQHAVSGFINEYGKYTVKDPPLGPCKVAILTRDKKGSMRPKATREGKGSGSGGMVLPDPEEIGMTYVAIPEKYEEIATSGLAVVVKAGDQVENFPLTRK
jgi:hypothetical protein